jgi:hypothetical protein
MHSLQLPVHLPVLLQVLPKVLPRVLGLEMPAARQQLLLKELA